MVRNEYIVDLSYSGYGEFKVKSFAEAKEVTRRRTGVSRIVATTSPALIRALIAHKRPGATSVSANSSRNWFVRNETELKQALRNWGDHVTLYTSASLKNPTFLGIIKRR